MPTKLQVARRARGMSQTVLAGLAGKLSTSEISRIECGHVRPYPAQAARLAAVLGLTVEELLEEADEPQPAAAPRA